MEGDVVIITAEVVVVEADLTAVNMQELFRSLRKIVSKAAIMNKLLRSLVLVAKSFPFYIIIFFLGRPLVRLGFAYFYCSFLNWLLVNAPFGDISVMHFFSDSLAVNSGSSADSNSNNLPLDEAPFNPIPIEDAAPFNNNNLIPLDVVDQFRILNQETEMELKANLLEQLVNLLLSESTERLTQILADSPFPERAIRPEALEFINDFLTRFNLDEPRSTFDKRVVEAMLRYWIQDAQQYGNISAVYIEFLRHFLGN